MSKKTKSLKGLKKGIEVWFRTRIRNEVPRKGIIVAVVKDSEFPNLEKFPNLSKKGFNKMSPREGKSFLVESYGQLYWPKVETVEEV